MFRLFSFFLPAVLCLLSACDKKEARSPRSSDADEVSAIVQKVNLCSRLHTTEYTIRKIVTFNDEVRLKGSLFSHAFNVKLSVGDRKVAIPMTVTLNGYIDLSRFGPDNVKRTESGIILTLPNPKIVLSASRIDHKNVLKYVSLLRSSFSAEELEAYQRQGVDSILSHLEDTDIVEQTRSNAVNTLMPLLRQLGYGEEQITIRFKSDEEEISRPEWLNIENFRPKQKK